MNRLMKLMCAVAAMVILGGSMAYAVPAYPWPINTVQSDGTEIAIQKYGDENSHRVEDINGYTILLDKTTKDWVYAELDEKGELVQSARKVGRSDPSLHSTPQHIKNQNDMSISRIKRQNLKDSMQKVVTTKGTVKNLVLLVEFNDIPFTYDKSDFNKLFNETGYSVGNAAGSVKDYYEEVSYGQLNMESIIAGPVKLSKGYAYYGANDKDGDDIRPREMVVEALELLFQSGFDFSQVDGDGDGWVDGFDVIHSGYDEAASDDEDCIWSHNWTISTTKTYGGVSFRTYHTEAELYIRDGNVGITAIGVPCHETGHFLGLPDLYDTDDSSSGIGSFCLMASGSWCGNGQRPAHMSAWCKIKLGWVTPSIISKAGDYTIPRVEDNRKIYKIQGDFPSTQYFLLENRQGYGFDGAIPGSTRGMLIWHIDDTKSSNNDENHYWVDLEEASGIQHLEGNKGIKGNDLDYFRSNTMSSFTTSTTPNTSGYSGQTLGFDIVNISSSSSTMSFSVINQAASVDPRWSFSLTDSTVGADGGCILKKTFGADGGTYDVSITCDSSYMGSDVIFLPSRSINGSWPDWFSDEILFTSSSNVAKWRLKVSPNNSTAANYVYVTVSYKELSQRVLIYQEGQSQSATTYTVTYNPGSYASGSTYTAIKTNNVALVLRNATYSRTGYTQAAWSTSSTGTSRNYELGANYTANAPLTLYPYWTTNTYTISYSLNGGAHGTTHPSSATYDTAFKVSAPSRSGYTFAGWTVTNGLNISTAKYGTTSSSQTTSITSSSQKCLNGATGDVWFKNLRSTSGSVTLTANWVPVSSRPENDNYANAASIAGAAGFANGSNENATREANEPYVYNQKGTNTVWWAWTAPATGVAVFDTNGSSFDTVMAAYAKTSSVSSLGSKLDTNDDDNSQGGSYRQSKITFDTASGSQYRIVVASYGATCGSVKLNWQQYVKVSFNGNGATSGAMSVQTNKYNTATTLPSCGFSRSDGYKFDGWATSAGGSVVYAPGASPKFTSNTTLYAHWTANTYDISYKLNGGTHGTTHPSPATYGTAFKVSAPSRTGYTFTGWTVTSGLNTSTAKYGTTSSSQTTSITSTTQKCFNGASGDVWFLNLTSTANGSVTLTANWTANTYSVTYDLDGGTHGTTHPSSATYDTAFKVSAPSRSGYTFAGWTVTNGLNISTAKYGTTSSSQTTSITSSSQKCLNGATGDVWFKNLRTTTGNVALKANWTCNHVSTVVQNARAATCTMAGYTGDTVCSTCGATISTGSTIQALGHQEGAGVVTKEPTTTEEGVMTYSCTRCGIVMRTEAIPKVVTTYPDLGFATFSNWDFGYSIFTTTNSEGGGVFSSAPVRLFDRGELFSIVFGYGNYGEAAISNATLNTIIEMVSEAGEVAFEDSAEDAWTVEPYRGSKIAHAYMAWTNLAAGVYTARVTLDAENAIGDTNRANNVREFVYAIRDSLSLGEALGCGKLVFNTSGDDWYGTRDGVDQTVAYARTKHLGNYGTNVLSTTVSGAGTLSFDWKVSSEKNYDWLEFLVDGVITNRISGTNCVWQSCSYELAGGNHVIEWRYRKDESYYAGLDCAWLANIEWNPTTVYTITFNSNGGTGTMTAQTFTNGVAQALRANAFTRTGYMFAGWATNTTGAVVYTNGASIAPNADMTLYAKWTGNTYAVTLNQQGGSGGTASVTATYGNSMPSIAKPTRSGYMFGGYYTSPNGSGTQYYTAAGVSARTWNIANATTLYANWIPTVPLNTALDNTALTFTTGGSANWVGVPDESYYGGSSAKSGAITHGQSTWMQTEATGEGTLSFWYKVSSETNWDKLMFYVDGVQKTAASGTVGWSRFECVISNSTQHVIKWTYSKDVSVSSGSDCCWIDKVEWTPKAVIPTIAVDASAETVNAAVDSVGFADAGVKAAIGGNASEYKAFKTWASGVAGGEAAVVASTNAAVSYLLDAERLFVNAPDIEFGKCEVATDTGEVTVSITVKDGEDAVVVASEKVKEMFEATSDLRDWSSAGKKLTPIVTDLTQGQSDKLNFKVRPGDGILPKAFLRIRK